MYPEKLEFEKGTVYYLESDCFSNTPAHLVHAYPHPHYNIKMHTHQFYEINLIVAGEGRHYVGDASLPARVGDVFVLPPEVAHGYHSDGRLDIFHVLLRAAFMQRYREELSDLPGFSLLFDVEPQVRASSGQSWHLHIPAHIREQLNTQAERIARAEQNAEYAYANVLTLAFIGRLGELLRQSVQENTLPVQETGVLRVMEYIKENIDQKLTLSLLAAKANMSVATLSRHFRDTLHASPMQYVMQCRLSAARELILKGGKSKSEVAQLCGFFDVSHMNKYL